MQDYQTRGTPWFILINGKNEVVFSDFHFDGEKLVQWLQDAGDAHE